MSNSMIGTYVAFERKKLDDDRLWGFVMDCSDDLTLIHFMADDFCFDGYSIFRNSDVTRYRTYDDPDEFMNRAFRLKRIRPRRPRGVDISCWHTAVATAGAKFPLLVLHREAMRSDVCYVGRYAGATTKTVTLFEITPEAEWEKPTRYRLADVTRIDFGGGYETALWEVASSEGPPPEIGA